MAEPPLFKFVSVPGLSLESTHGSPYLGASVVLVPERIAEELLSTCTETLDNLAFKPPIPYRIGPSAHGMGLFAAQSLSVGDLMITERPFSVTPTILPLYDLSESLSRLDPEARERIVMDAWESRYLRPLVASLGPVAQADYLALKNAYAEEGVPLVLGIIRTNGLDIGDLTTDSSTAELEGIEYGAVCKTMSRINHSCRPNAERVFDLHSFTFQLRALRDIQEGDEITIAYCGILLKAETRQRELEYWKFRCTCASCMGDVAGSDGRRFGVWQSVKDLDTSFGHASLQEKIENSLKWISIIREEGLEGSSGYLRHLKVLADAYSDAGDDRESTKHAEMFAKCRLAQKGEEVTGGLGRNRPSIDMNRE